MRRAVKLGMFYVCLVVSAVLLGGAEPVKIDLSTLKNGEAAPKVENNELIFSPASGFSQAAETLQHFDLSRGARITLEFQVDGPQQNDYARLLEAKGLSFHFNNREGSIVKIYARQGGSKFVQAPAPCGLKPGEWRRAELIYDAENQQIGVSIDGGKLFTASLPGLLPDASDTALILGAPTLTVGNRGFAGRLRNLEVTTPYSGDPRCRREDLSKPTVINGEEVKYSTVTSTPGRHCAFPGIAKLADGRLAVVFREGEAHVCPYGRIAISYSYDGVNWSVPQVVVDTMTDDRDPSIRQLEDGRLLLTNFRHGIWANHPTYQGKYPAAAYAVRSGDNLDSGYTYRFSDDAGKSWGEPVEVPAFTPHGPAIKAGSFYHPIAQTGADGIRRINVYRGSADARNWEKIGSAYDSPASAKINEPHLVALRDGTLLGAIRDDSDHLLVITRSVDDGKSWEAVKTEFFGLPPHLLELSDGRVLLTYGYRSAPYGVRARVSEDGGRNWGEEMILRRNGIDTDLGYPMSVEIEPGRVATVYYHHTNSGKPFIEVAIWRP